MRVKTFASLSLVLTSICTANIGLAENDVLTLHNGDQITGEIKKIWGDEIMIEPSYADEFEVDVDAVSHIESEREFDITLEDGTAITGTLSGVDEDGNQLVVHEGGTLAFPLMQLEELDEIDDYFDWDSWIDFNASINKGNTDSENTMLRAETNLKLGDHRHIAVLTLTDEEQFGITTKDQDFLTYNYNWLFNDPWYLGGIGTYERDPIRDLNQRLIVAATIGRDIWNQSFRLLTFQLGLGYLDEELANVPDESSVGIWSLRFRYDFRNGDLELYHDNQYTKYISGRDNSFVKSTTGVRYEISDLFYANFSIGRDYEGQPAPGTKKEDITYIMGIGAEF